jgi:four helix bundle protein
METLKSYLDLDVWKKSRNLTKEVYVLTKSFPKEELYGLTNQIRRSAVSVTSNIAEGSGRQTAKDTIQFLYIARGSLYELETQLFIASDLEYLNAKQLENLVVVITECKKLLNGFIKYYKNPKYS